MGTLDDYTCVSNASKTMCRAPKANLATQVDFSLERNEHRAHVFVLIKKANETGNLDDCERQYLDMFAAGWTDALPDNSKYLS